MLRRDNARTGYAIGALGSDNVFYGFLNEELSAKRAAAVANAAPGEHAVQDMMIDRKIPTAELETFAGYAIKMRNSGALNLDGVQLSLFAGKDHSAMLAAMEKESKAASREAADLDKKASSLESLLKAGKTLSTAELRKHGARAGDREGLKMEAQALRAEADRWRNFFHYPDILAQVQERAGTAIKPETFSQSENKKRHREYYIQKQQEGLSADPVHGSQKFEEIVNEAFSNPKANQPVKLFMKVDDAVAHKARDEVGIDISGFAHGIDGSNVRHATNRHGEGAERQKDQVPINRNDYAMIPRVLAEPDVIQYRGVSDEGHPIIQFGKRIDGMLYVAEEVLINSRRLVIKTLVKQKGDRLGPTPETPTRSTRLPRAESPTPNSIPPAAGIVNPDETFEQEVRGETRGAVDLYRADDTHRQAAVIRVMKNGDMSTVLHELSHIFLADMRDYVAAGGADIDTVRDYGKLLRAAGDLSVEGNVEQIARWFEEYLREGRAPSVELVKPFGLFSKWLTRVYSNVREYAGAEMDAETRGVFDRWLASEREIAEAEAYYGGLNSTDFLNLIDDDEKKRKLAEELERTRQRVVNRHAGEMAKAWTGANADRGKLAEEARQEAGELPVYRAIEAAKASGLDRAAAEKTVGKDAVLKIVDRHGDVFAREVKSIELEATLRKVGYHEKDPVALFLKELSEAVPVEEAVRKRGAQGRRTRYYEALDNIAKAGGIDPDVLAFLPDIDMDGLERHRGLFRPDGRENLDRIAMATGFTNPSAMLEAMARAQNIDAVVERLAERKARAKAKEARAWAEESLAGMMDDTPPAGQSALHDPDEDIMAEGIEMQRRALRQALEAKEHRRSVYVERRAMEDAARQTLYAKPLREAMDYNNHAKAERYWSGRAAEAMARGNRKAALAALDKQQKFHALSTESFRIRRDFTDFMRRYGQRVAQSELATVETAYRDAVRDILVWSGVVVDKSGRFAPENSDPDRLILPEDIRDNFDIAKDGEFDASLEAFSPSMETLIPEWIRFKKLPMGYTGNILDLTPAMMADIQYHLYRQPRCRAHTREGVAKRGWEALSPGGNAYRANRIDGR